MLPDRVVEHRLSLLAEVSRMLLAIVPQERDRNLAEEQTSYEIGLPALLDNPPLP